MRTKRPMLRHIINVVIIASFASLLYAAGSYMVARAIIKQHFSPERNNEVKSLASALATERSHKNIKALLDEYCHASGITSAVTYTDDTNAMTFECSARRCAAGAGFFTVTYPLRLDGKTRGFLTLGVGSAAVFSGPLKTKEPLSLLLLVLAFGWFVTLAVYVYLRKNVLYPAALISSFLDNLDKNRFAPLSAVSYGKGWRDAAAKLNSLSDKLAHTADMHQMLFSISKALTSRLEINEIVNVIMEIIRKKYDNVSCAVVMLGEDGFLKIINQRGFSPDFVKSIHLRPGEGFVGQAFQKCQTIVVNDAAAQSSAATIEAVEREEIASFVHVPLTVDGKCAGLLSVNSRQKDYFTVDKVEAAAAMAEYLSIAMRNIQLYERVQELNRRLETEVSSTTMELIQTNSRLIQKVREMKALSDIAAFAAAKSDLSEILDMIVDKIKELLTAQAAGFFLYERETNDLVPHPPFFGIRDKEFSRMRFHLDEVKVLESAIREGKQHLINDVRSAQEALPLLTNLLSIHSLVLVPLRSGSKPIGVLGAANKFSAPFTQDDVRILELIADRIAGVIENVTLYQEVGQRLKDLTTLQDISSAISSEPVLEKVIHKIILPTTRAFGADLCALLLFDEKTRELVTQPGAYFTGGDEAVLLRIPADDANSLSAQTFRSGEPFLSPDASIDPRIKSQTARLWDVRSLILVPLRAENRVIGVLRIGKHQANCYTRDNLRLANLIAHQAAVIIENAHLYASLKEAKSEQERLNQVKNEFLSVVSHELRTPITAIKGFVKLVLHGEAGKLNPQQEKFLQIADQSTDRLTVLISDLLDISKIEAGKLNIAVEPVNVPVLVEEVMRNIAPEAKKKNLALVSELNGKLPPVMADRERLMQVFNNLISNAIKFTPAGGTITVGAADKGDGIILGVKDTGIGIAEKDRQKIFEKFYQVNSGTTRTMPGAGLGLAIVKSIVDMHGGEVWVESEAGKGSEFKFIIPRAKTEMKNFHQDAN